MLNRIPNVTIVLVLLAAAAPCQAIHPDDSGSSTTAATGNRPAGKPESNHVLWIIPNYRTSPSLIDFKPLTVHEKFTIGARDAFDRGTFGLAALFASKAMLTNADPAFGQGAAGYGKYFGSAYADFAIGDLMTEAIFPSLLHQDPRYFRRGAGSGWSRLRYAAAQILVTRTNSGKTQFNFSEVIGNASAVAISNAYYADNRTASNAVSQMGVQLGADVAANILKEFWPDLQRKFARRRIHADRSSHDDSERSVDGAGLAVSSESSGVANRPFAEK